jgi:phosphoribosyl 1,2-cyclic phosphodiesterase
MKLRFWGTRGSVPTPGRNTIRYGGNTPCVEVRLSGNQLIVLDAGTGIRNLGDALIASGKPIHATILITHSHWDHIQGFPFFKPAYRGTSKLTIVGAPSENRAVRKILSDQMHRVHFPIRLAEMKARMKFIPIQEETITVSPATVQSCYVNHSSSALGYRIEEKGRSVVYISDNEPFDRKRSHSVRNINKRILKLFLKTGGNPNNKIVSFARGADVLIHDATYTPSEYARHIGWGHSDYVFALKLAAKAGVKKLILFHHDQSHSDDRIDMIVRRCREIIKTRGYRFSCSAASEGLVVEW